MRISDWSSDVCSSDLTASFHPPKVRRTNTIISPNEASPSTTGCGEASGTSSSPATMITSSPSTSAMVSKIGRASRRESVGQYVYTPVVAVSLKNQHIPTHNTTVIYSKLNTTLI